MPKTHMNILHTDHEGSSSRKGSLYLQCTDDTVVGWELLLALMTAPTSPRVAWPPCSVESGTQSGHVTRDATSQGTHPRGKMLFLGFAAVPSMVAPTPPKVSAPADFVAPTPKPLTMTRPPQEALPGLITGGMALAVRLATGAEDARTTVASQSHRFTSYLPRHA